MEYYNFDDVANRLNISRKQLDNYAKIGQELPYEKRRVGRGNPYTILEEDLLSWKKHAEFSMMNLDREDYIKCLEFAILSFYHYKSTSDFGTSQQRDAGKFITNFVIGKLGEIAVQKFLKRNFDIETSLDFDIREEVVGQDIVEISKPRRGGRVANPPRLRIAIKTSKIKNVFLIVPANEVEDSERNSDIYIFTRVDLYLNHFIRLLKTHDSLSRLSNIIPEFEFLQAQVCGFTKLEDINDAPPVKILPKMNQEIKLSYIMPTGKLYRNKDDWASLIDQL